MDGSTINERSVWPQSFTSQSIISILVTIIILNIAFIEYYTPIPIFIVILVTTVGFFQLLRNYSINWLKSPLNVLYGKMFMHSIFYRIVFLGVIYLMTYLYDPGNLPMELTAADAWKYWASGKELTGSIFNGEFINKLSLYWRSPADYGFPFFIGVLNTILFESIFIVKLMNILISAHSVVLLSKIAVLLYGEKHGKFTGIVAMLLPSLLWFSGLFLKETLMIYIICIVFYNVIKMIKLSNFSVNGTLLIVLGISSFYFFRTAMVVVLILSVGIYLLLNLTSRRNKFIPFMVGVIVFSGLIVTTVLSGELQEITREYESIGGAGETVIGSKINAVGNINLTTQLALPLLSINSIISPYPSVLNMDDRQESIMTHSQNEFIRILIFYFGIIGILYCFKNDLRNSSLLIAFSLGYIVLVAIVGKSYEDRFQLPAVPFVLILSSVGFLNSSQKWLNFFNKYTIIIIFATVSWHIFKLYIRGYFN